MASGRWQVLEGRDLASSHGALLLLLEPHLLDELLGQVELGRHARHGVAIAEEK